jgi:N-acetyl-anhydromuramyl-L-alanine amidase AmpD
MSDGPLVDRRGLHPRARRWGGRRAWAAIEGVTLHQTGCDMPGRVAGWDRLGAHVGVLRSGTVVLVNDPTEMIWHAQGLSRTTIGIEVEGNFPGVEGDDSTLWQPGGPAAHLTGAQLAGLDALFVWLRAEFTAHGARWMRVHAHRQAKNTRLADPGSAIWQRVALPWMERLGATDGGPGWRIGTGRPIPREWDPRSAVAYRGAA